MAAKVQRESYLLGHSSVGNLNADSGCSWFPYYEDKTSNEHLYNGLVFRPIPEYSSYDIEMVKRTMLQHEAIFRKQVHELHRLYGVQKNLMDEHRRKEIYKLPRQSGMASKITKENWQSPHKTIARTGFSMTTDADIIDFKRSLEPLEENYMNFSDFARPNRDSKSEGCPKQMLDLQLPADLYISVDDSGRKKEHEPFCGVEEFSNVTCDIEQENDVILTLGTKKNYSKGNCSSYAIPQKGHSVQSMDYFNESETGLYCGEQSALVFRKIMYPGSSNEYAHGQHSPTRSNIGFQPMDFFNAKHRDEGANSDFLSTERGKALPESSSFNYNDAGRNETGVNLFTLDLSSENCSMLSGQSAPNVRKEHSASSYDHGEMQTWFKEEQAPGSGDCQEDSPFVDSNNLEVSNYQVPGTLSIIPFSDSVSCASPVVSLQRKRSRVVTHIPIAVQALPCFPASDIMNLRSKKLKSTIGHSVIAQKNLLPDGSSEPLVGGGIEFTASRNGCHKDFCSESSSLSQLKDSSCSSIFGNSGGCASQKACKLPKDVSFHLSPPNGTREVGKLVESSEGVSWLTTKASSTDSQVEFSFSKSLHRSPEKFLTSSQVKGSNKHKYRSLHSVRTEKILGFPVTDELQQGTKVREEEAKENKIDLNTLQISTPDDDPIFTRKISHETDQEFQIPLYETVDDSLAAKSLLLISCSVTEQLVPASCDSLNWFADVVCSKAYTTNHDDDNGEDSFESLTLKLEELKPDEYLPQPPEQQKEEKDIGKISLLLTKTRRGQLRKRRQKKDFQKDILPGLVSLSRHELEEDLQAFDCLMKAMGEPWESNLTRKGSSGRRKGKCRARNLFVSFKEDCLSSPPTQVEAPSAKVETSERSVIGWGWRTRRGRRPRIKPGNASLINVC